MSLFFVCKHDNIVFTFSPAEEGQWRFSRLSSFQKNKGLEKFVLLRRRAEQADGWVVMDQTTSKWDVIGKPTQAATVTQWLELPPLGSWELWGASFYLSGSMPRHPALLPEQTFPMEVPFATFNYSEEGPVARLEVKMHNVPIVDDVLEHVLSRFSALLRNLAQRPEMVLFIRSDARNSAVPAVRHIKRFLGFVQENGSEFVLVGRGHAIVLSPKGILGNTLLAILRLVQRVFPAPWPESTVPTMDDAEEFLRGLAKEELSRQVKPHSGPEAHDYESPLVPSSPANPTVEVEPNAAELAKELSGAPSRSRPSSPTPSRAPSSPVLQESSGGVVNCKSQASGDEASGLMKIPGLGSVSDFETKDDREGATPTSMATSPTHCVMGDTIENVTPSPGLRFPWFCSCFDQSRMPSD